MCCFKDRKTPATIVLIASLVGAIAGITMIFFSLNFINSDLMEAVSQSVSGIEQYRNMGAQGLLTLSLLATIISLLGVGLYCCKHPCFAVGFGLLLLPSFLLILIFGLVLSGISYGTAVQVDAVCAEIQQGVDNALAEGADAAAAAAANAGSGSDGADADADGEADADEAADASVMPDLSTMTDEQLKAYYEQNSDFEVSFDIYRTVKVNEYMCSTICPCQSTTKDSDWSGVNVDLDERQKYARQLPITFGPRPTESKTIDTYLQCLEQTASGELTQGEDIESKKFVGFAQALTSAEQYESMVKFVELVEDSYSCAGVCDVSLFSISQSVANGRPEQNCIQGVKDDLAGELLNLGVAATVCGFVLSVAFFWQYCLWKRYDDRK